MMKKLLILLSIICGFNSFASHILGGHMQVLYYSTDSVEITTTLTTDPGGITSPNFIYLDEYKTNSVGSYQWRGSIQSSKDSTYSFQGYVITIYKTKRSIYSGNYRWVYENCCRGMLSNASSAINSNFTIGIDYQKDTLISNSSPILLNQLPINWVVNDTAQSIILAFDLDGDSVIVEKDDALNQYSTTGTFVPLAPFSQLDTYGTYYVDVSGLVIWGPTTTGVYGTGYKVSEYRNGTLIGVNRIQQVYSVVQGSTPSIPWPFIQVNHDLLNGDSTEIYIHSLNATNTELFIPEVDVTKTSDSTWTLENLQVGTYRAVARVTNGSSNNDYQFTFMVRSTIGIEENIADRNTQYEVYDWYGRYLGTSLENQKGFLILRYSNGKVEKVFCN